jgi:hypothetical protein
MKKLGVTTMAVAVMVMGTAISADAQTVQFTGPIEDPHCDVWVNGWEDCLGNYLGNNVGNQATMDAVLAEMADAGWGDLWYVGTTNAGEPGSADPFEAFDDGMTSGTLYFTNPISGVFAIALKGGEYFSLYLFDTGGAVWSSLDFSMAGVTNEPLSALSHASLYGGTQVTVPEPMGMLLLGTGLLGVGAALRRRRQDGALEA